MKCASEDLAAHELSKVDHLGIKLNNLVDVNWNNQLLRVRLSLSLPCLLSVDLEQGLLLCVVKLSERRILFKNLFNLSLNAGLLYLLDRRDRGNWLLFNL